MSIKYSGDALYFEQSQDECHMSRLLCDQSKVGLMAEAHSVKRCTPGISVFFVLDGWDDCKFTHKMPSSTWAYGIPGEL